MYGGVGCLYYWSHRGGHLNPDVGWRLVYGVPCNNVVVMVLTFQRLLVDVTLVLVGL